MKKKDEMKLKVIVISSSRANEEEPEIVIQLFENGLNTFHLRKPKFSTRELRNYILQIPVKFHSRIIIHSHHILARKFNLKGVHLTKVHQRNKFKTWLTLKLLKIKIPDLIITTSYSRLSNLFEEARPFDYVFLSPIFDSLSSKYQSGFSEQRLKAAMLKTPCHVVARGGIEISSVEKVKEIGFSGLALYSAIWKKKDPLLEFKQFMKKCQDLGIDVE